MIGEIFQHNGNTYKIVTDNQVSLRYLASVGEELYIPKYALYQDKQYLVTGIEPGSESITHKYNSEKDGRKKPKWEYSSYSVKCNVFKETTNGYKVSHSLRKVNFPDTIRVIGSYAFFEVKTNSFLTLSLPRSLEIIGDRAFKGVSLDILSFPNGLTTIGNNAFEECQHIRSLVIPDSVQSIGAHSFFYCSQLQYLTIGSGITSIGEYAFGRCEKLKVVHIYKDPFEAMIASNAFPEDVKIIYHKPDEPRIKYIPNDKMKALSRLMGILKLNVIDNKIDVANNKSSKLSPSILPEKEQTPVIDLDKLMDAVVVDGVITDKERSVILKKATAAGYDADEVEILLDAKLAEKLNANKAAAAEQQKKVELAKKETAPVAKDATSEEKSGNGAREYSKYAVNGEGKYGKGRMVEAVVNKYVELNPNVTVQKLKEVFPERLQGSNFIKDSTETITDMKRYYESALPGGAKFYISNQWGTQTDAFVEYVNKDIDGITVSKL